MVVKEERAVGFPGKFAHDDWAARRLEGLHVQAVLLQNLGHELRAVIGAFFTSRYAGLPAQADGLLDVSIEVLLQVLINFCECIHRSPPEDFSQL